jgi:NAD(P)-dependent dehydrogenase (short-subunit alcohol dehydrogenase family)
VSIVITGASQGIGAAIANAFADRSDARLVLVARNEENLEHVAALCRDRGAEVDTIACDVTQDRDVASMARAVLAESGPPTILVNNAGRFAPGRLVDTSAELFRSQLEVNLTSAFLVTRAFLPAMLEADRGHLFFLASVASVQGYAGGAAYCAAKHGLLGLARVLRQETKSSRLRVTAVLPGATLTPAWDGANIPEENFVPAADVARSIVDIASLDERTNVEEILIRPQPGDVKT